MRQEPLSPRMLVACAGAGSAFALAGALIFQAMGYAPCELCIWQRWPHLAAALIAFAIVGFKLPRWTILSGALAALITSGLGFYHSGVERHIFAGPESCTSNPVSTSMSAADLMEQINSASLMLCDQIQWDMFGMTMANLNAVGALVLAGIWIRAYLKAGRTA